MNSKNREKFFAAFPRLYRDAIEQYNPDVPMSKFFWCRDGWFDLLFNLSANIEQQAREEGLESDSAEWPNVHTVKEKFGKLVFLVFSGRGIASGTIASLIDEAKAQSERTCDLCGNPGSMRTDGGCWRVRCEHCNQNCPP